MIESTQSLVQTVFAKSAFRFKEADPVTGTVRVKREAFTAAEEALWQRLRAGQFLRRTNEVHFSSGGNLDNNSIVVSVLGEEMHFFPEGCYPCYIPNPLA